MKQCALILLALLVSSGSLLAQDPGIPDTVYFGDDGKAYGYSGGAYRVPVYLSTDEELIVVQIAFEYGLGSLAPSFDSISIFGSFLMEENYFDLGFPLLAQHSIDGVMPDSLAFAGVCMTQRMPPIRGLLCDVWFTGGNIGEFALIDSCTHAVVGPTLFSSDGSGYIYPQIVGAGSLEIVQGQPLIIPILPDSIVGDAGSELDFEISAIATEPPVTIVLDSIISVGSGVPLYYFPAVSGTNPVLIEWIPTYNDFGSWLFWFTATDALMGELQFSALVKVNWVQPPCDVLRGDANCDDMVNITDVVHLINYIFSQGPPPGCGDE